MALGFTIGRIAVATALAFDLGRRKRFSFAILFAIPMALVTPAFSLGRADMMHNMFLMMMGTRRNHWLYNTAAHNKNERGYHG